MNNEILATIDRAFLEGAVGGATAPSRSRVGSCLRVLQNPLDELGSAVIGHPSADVVGCFNRAR